MEDSDGPVPDRSRRPRRAWRRRLVLVGAVVLASLCLLSASAVWYVRSWYSGLHRIKIVHAASLPQVTEPSNMAQRAVGEATSTTHVTATPAVALGPSKAMNVLLTGSDGRSCIDPTSPYAGAFLGAGTNTGTRSDTIIVVRIDPTMKQLGLLSFPRDLWVTIAGTNHKDKINAAFKPDDPSPLIQTIEANFGIRIDHYLGVDFCAFKSMVDAVGGLAVPFVYPTRDVHTGLNVAEPGCHAMSGDEALAYVRSRYYEYQIDGHWVTDGTSDYGRIARQQDFVRRLVAKALATGVTSPLTAKHLLDVAKSADVRIDDGLSLTDMIRMGNSIRDLGLQHASSYRLEGQGRVIGGADVIVPDLTSSSAQAIIAFFRGDHPPTATLTTTTTTPGSIVARTALAGPTTTAGPTNNRGIFPPADIPC